MRPSRTARARHDEQVPAQEGRREAAQAFETCARIGDLDHAQARVAEQSPQRRQREVVEMPAIPPVGLTPRRQVAWAPEPAGRDGKLPGHEREAVLRVGHVRDPQE